MATDLDSRNGTALNGEPLDRPRRLRDGDTLIVGGHRLEVSDPVPATPVGATVAAAEPVGRAHRRGAGDRGGAGRSLPQRGRLRRPSRDPRRDRRGAARQRAHRPAPPRRPRRQARRPRRRRPRAPAPDRRPGDRARPRPPPLTRTGPNALARSGEAPASLAALRAASGASVAQMQPTRKGSPMLNRSIFTAFLALARSPFRRVAAPGRRRLLAGHREPARGRSRVRAKKASVPKGGLYAAKEGHLNQLTEDPADSEPAFSADGRKIAFVRSGDVWAMRADGTGQHKLTSGAEVDSRPAVLTRRPLRRLRAPQRRRRQPARPLPRRPRRQRPRARLRRLTTSTKPRSRPTGERSSSSAASPRPAAASPTTSFRCGLPGPAWRA